MVRHYHWPIMGRKRDLWDLLVPKFGTQVLDLLLDPRTLGEASRAARPDLTPTISQGGVGEAVNIGQSKVSRFLLQHGGCHRDTRIVPPYLTSHSNYSFGAGKGKMLGPFRSLNYLTGSFEFTNSFQFFSQAFRPNLQELCPSLFHPFH